MSESRNLLAMAGGLAAGLLASACLLAADNPTQPVAAGTAPGRVFNIREFGAAGDGSRLDTAAINQAIEACAGGGGGKVLFPPGRYLSGTVRLRSRVTLFFDAGATLVGTTNLALYQQPTVPASLPEAKFGKWHRALLLGEGVEDVALAGQGVIDGNKVFDPTGEEHMRGPHTILFVDCRRFTIRDLSVVDSANYGIFFQISDQVEVRNVKFTGGWDGVHFRGGPDRPCRDVSIVGCQFYTGDDSIAGRYWDNVLISDCIVNSSCNGIRLIGPATRLMIHDCLFYGPGMQPHRSSKRYNMLSGIILQPGAWDATRGALDEVLISDVTMHKVASPLTVWIMPGNTLGRVTVDGLKATAVYRSALSVESWADTPATNLVFRNLSIEYDGGGKPEQARQAVRRPGVDARPLPAWGFCARHVQQVTFEDCRLSCAQDDLRPVVWADGLERLNLDAFKYTRVPGVTAAFALTNIGKLNLRDTDAPGSSAR